jgi:hypothetical protein
VSTLFAIFVTRWMSRWKRYQVEPPVDGESASGTVATSGGVA